MRIMSRLKSIETIEYKIKNYSQKPFQQFLKQCEK